MSGSVATPDPPQIDPRSTPDRPQIGPTASHSPVPSSRLSSKSMWRTDGMQGDDDEEEEEEEEEAEEEVVLVVVVSTVTSSGSVPLISLRPRLST